MSGFDFKDSENFEPSRETKKWWLYTHKSDTHVAGLVLPGLFQTTYYGWHLAGLFLVFLFEGGATFWSSLEGVIITAIVGSLLVDFVLAIWSHTYQKDICKLKNDLLFNPDKSLGNIERKLKSKKFMQRLVYVLIGVSALFKIFWFFNVYQVIDATTLLIVTFYILGAILHITCTGYALFTFIFNWRMDREHNKFLDSNHEEFSFNSNEPNKMLLSSSDFQEAEVGKHKVTKSDDGKMHLETFGILTDTQLSNLVAKQESKESKRILSLEGVEHQMTIHDQDPL